MKNGRVVKASDYKYVKTVDVPEEVIEFFECLKSKYKHNDFIVDINPFKGETEINIEIMVYDDYVE